MSQNRKILAILAICFWFTNPRLFAQQIQGVGAGGGSGTVTSVGLSLPSILTVTGSPVTTAGTLTGTLANQSANIFFGGPTSGAAAAPTFRALASSDLPNPTVTTLTASQTLTAAQSGSTIVMNCAAACTVTLPTTPAAGTNFLIVTEGAANAAIALGGTDTYNLVASVPVLLKYFGAFVIADGAGNWTGPTPLVAGTNITLTPASNGLTIAATGGSGVVAYTAYQNSGNISGTSNFSINTVGSISLANSGVSLVSVSGTVAALYVRFTANLASTDSFATTVFHNSLATTMTCTVAASTATCNDLTHTFSVTAGDTLDYHTVCTGVGNCATPSQVSWALKITGAT